MSEVGERIAEIRYRIERARPGRQCQLMAVTKGQGGERIDQAIAAGVHLFGENRVQEAGAKWPRGTGAVKLHMIGHLQKNKINSAIPLFIAIDSIDSEGLAEALNARLTRRLSVMLQVNVGQEPSKFGVSSDAVRPFLAQAQKWSWLKFDGILAVLPQARDSSAAEGKRIRRLMQETSELWRSCQIDQWPWAPLPELSMGMSGDFEWAVEAGATIVRIGQGIFGPRG